jgi:hypothetical protein
MPKLLLLEKMRSRWGLPEVLFLEGSGPAETACKLGQKAFDEAYSLAGGTAVHGLLLLKSAAPQFNTSQDCSK